MHTNSILGFAQKLPKLDMVFAVDSETPNANACFLVCAIAIIESSRDKFHKTLKEHIFLRFGSILPSVFIGSAGYDRLN